VPLIGKGVRTRLDHGPAPISLSQGRDKIVRGQSAVKGHHMDLHNPVTTVMLGWFTEIRQPRGPHPRAATKAPWRLRPDRQYDIGGVHAQKPGQTK